MNPVEVFERLRADELPLILSFPIEEGKGHLITAKGICYVDRIHGTSRVSLGRFSPPRLVGYLGRCASFYVTFEALGRTYGCFLRDLSVDGNSLTASIPESLSPFMRRFLRVEPSLKAPVLLHVCPRESGTLTLAVRDISECGLGLLTPQSVELDERFVCCIELPGDGRTLVVQPAAVVYKTDALRAVAPSPYAGRSCHSRFYGIESFPHQEDQKKIRMYIMQREIEIRRLLHG